MRDLPSLPGCGGPASVRVELFARTSGNLLRQTDSDAYACADHFGAIEVMLYDAGYHPRRDDRYHGNDGRRCGDLVTDPDGSPAAVAAFVARMRLPEPDGHPRWCVRDEAMPMHYSTEFRVAERLSVQVHQEYTATAPVVALILGGERRGVAFPLDVAAALSRQLAAAVRMAGGR